jgi:16S rRNA C967 or C1407 C5-methylase (RsmB/RsmF family)/NOL1/NOP2/fmu family ribosome biogenesis protein
VEQLLGDEAQPLLRALRTESPVSIRLNPLKPAEIVGEQVPWCAQGRYLMERPSFTLDPRFHAGAYYVQEASSMLIEQAFRATGLMGRDNLALDLCAAPGGKSTHLASLLTSGSLLVCNEAVPARRGPLMENLWKHGRGNTMVTGSPPSDFDRLNGLFDLILVDAPCSGEGMFRKDPFARQQWSEGLVRSCASTQGAILHHAWHALRPGGWLIYSTCTWERKENEEQVLRLVAQGAEHVPLLAPSEWGTLSSDVGLRCYPHRVKGEGFFIALLRKPGRSDERTLGGTTPDGWTEVRQWLRDPGTLALCEQEEVSYASPAHWSGMVDRLKKELKVMAPGIPVAERKGATWRPHAALALNEILAVNAFGAVDLQREQALTFLRGETALSPGSNAVNKAGVRLVRYGGLPLGWMHAAGDRWNNGWPKAWRIRMR